MPLFVHILRSAMLFMNIYDTYKTLKPPPPSTRDPSRPSVRAATQRKRDLKGCLAVWIVWCCFTLYERLIEGFVNLFIPFYDEFKSMVVLFMIITRARGAEPIFLHVLRPLIRPYDASIDGTLEVLRMTGDFVFALASFPVQLAIDYWKNKFSPDFKVPEKDSECSSDTSDSRSIGNDAVDQAAGSALNGGKFAQKPHQPPIRRTSGDSTRTLVAGDPRKKSSPHEIWHPPRSAYEDHSGIVRTASNGSASSGSTGVIELTKEEKEIEEWRKYPDFPSAYPPTPLTTTVHLSSTTAVVGAQLFAPIPEDEPPQQDFHRSLKQPRSQLNPSYADDLSDQSEVTHGIHQYNGFAGTSTTAVETEDESMSDGSYEEEDTFDITLQTPLQPHISLRTPRAPLLAAFPSQSTAVDSVDSTSSLQTRTPSAQSHGSVSPTPSLSGTSSSAMEVDSEQPFVKASDENGRVRRPQITAGRERSGTTMQRRLRPRPSPVKKRKIARSNLSEGGTSTTSTGEEDNKETSGANGEGIAEDVYVPPVQKTPLKKRPRMAGTTRKTPSTTTTSGTSRTVKPRVARRTSPVQRPQLTRTQPSGSRLGTTATSSRKSSTRSAAGSRLPRRNTDSTQNLVSTRRNGDAPSHSITTQGSVSSSAASTASDSAQEKHASSSRPKRIVGSSTLS
ncbi:hypothetical protein CC1G_08862 [Coprinopsis cinerea okayama7|uniref:Protein YOP1 n=1 Tax=Coprinopsis cinerea (strain Okayama-7 / 130 / ATCC MYA-4618 / FGSC 9003) TaxID=240176 RepID=A8P6D8_COPC7|nr:hypothetical protein CC1G_08862 [Coprinopsis cinerea okayama7\|eukprot:XP_001839136.2 hypothetical protein CC1G_08862 [Coprinopsis cinerea okayama7\